MLCETIDLGHEKIQVFFMLTGSAIVLVVILFPVFLREGVSFACAGVLIRPLSNVAAPIGDVEPMQCEIFEQLLNRGIVGGYGKMVTFLQADVHSLQGP